MIKTSTEINSIVKLCGEERAVYEVARAGFDAWDFTIEGMVAYDWATNTPHPTNHPLAGNDYLKFARKLKQIGLDNGIHCNQSHAPAPTFSPLMLDYLYRSIECTAEVGGDVCVIHPGNNLSPEENAIMYDKLIPFAKGCGVRIATENMWNWDNKRDCASPAACSDPESFNAHLDAVSAGPLWACLDIGHAEMEGLGTSAVQMIRALGNRLAALHIHDNDKHYDSHQIPRSMSINFDEVLLALKDVNYNGYFTLESYSHLKKFTADNVSDGVRDLSRAARQLAEQYENL